MDNQYAIEVNNISKHFKIYVDKGNTVKEKLLFWKRNRYEEKVVLDNVSFKVKKGESVGLIGHNGCGKSTTLKILTQIMYPDSGEVKVNGRVSSLLELGAGFHPDMTGLENIYINAAIFGLTKVEIDKRLQDIIDFAELGDYINNPVRTYSSGMYMRLAFSVAINVKADVLLVDEILAVGDVNFQAKCFDKLLELKRQGLTIVLVSHSMEQVERVCERCIWLQDGQIKMQGTPKDVQDAYGLYMEEVRKGKEAKTEAKKDKDIMETQEDSSVLKGNGQARILEAYCYDDAKNKIDVVNICDTVHFVAKYKAEKPVNNVVIEASLYRKDGVRCIVVNSLDDLQRGIDLEKVGFIELTVDSMQLLPGVYRLSITITNSQGELVDYDDNALTFQITGAKYIGGVTWLNHSWKV